MKWEARRYSGEVKLYVRFNDESDEWEVSVNTKDGRRVIHLDSQAWLDCGNAVDSPEAWDHACYSALSFSIDDDESGADGQDLGTQGYCSYTETGEYHIAREFKTAFAENAR